MSELSAPEWGNTLLARELWRLRVETVVAADTALGDTGFGDTALGDTALGDTALGDTAFGALGMLAADLPRRPGLPPTSPDALAAAVWDRIGQGRLLGIVGFAPPDPDPAPEPGVERRVDAATALLTSIGSGRDGAPMAALARESWVAAPPGPGGGGGVHLDQQAAWRLARFWELGREPVVCRTMVRMDGDAVTQLPAEGAWPSSVPRSAVIRAHTAIALAAIAAWPVLFCTAGSLVLALLPRAPGVRRLSRPRWPWRVATGTAGGLRPFAPRAFLRACRQFLAWGRVVFESPAPGAGASIRSMVHPSGDVETTVMGPATDRDLSEHATLVSCWIRRMELSLGRLDDLFDLVPWVLWAGGVVAAGSNYAVGGGWIVSAAVALVVLAGGWIARWALRAWCRRRLAALVTVKRERVESPAR